MSEIALAFFLFLAWIAGTIWVFADATVNSSKSAVLWGLVAFFGGILGVLLYALLGRDGGETDRTPTNGRDTPRGNPSHVCESCGEEYYTDASTEIRSCRRCGGIRVERT